jgi:hypothetical protein
VPLLALRKDKAIKQMLGGGKPIKEREQQHGLIKWRFKPVREVINQIIAAGESHD